MSQPPVFGGPPDPFGPPQPGQFGPPQFGPPGQFGGPGPYGPPPQVGPPGQFGGPGPYGPPWPPQPGYYPMGTPPAKKSRMWLLIGAPVVALVLIAAGLTAFFVFYESDKELITNATYSFADAINRDDMSAATALMCADRANALQDTDDSGSPSTPDAEQQDRGFTVTEVKVDGDHAAATLKFDSTGTTRQLDFRKEGGDWKVCGQ